MLSLPHMPLPIHPPFAPMEALSVDAIPRGANWGYEPKWDGFRCLAFRDGASVELQSKSGQSLTRYFPEMVEAVGAVPAERFVLDGEIVVPEGEAFSFDALLQRIHPAASRVKKLSVETPGLYIVFDLLVDTRGEAVVDLTQAERRDRLEAFAAAHLLGHPNVRLSPATTALAGAQAWLKEVGATLDGIIAKRRDLPYRAGERTGMQKIKNHRSADCVVGGFRYGAGKPTVGSLLLGLYDDAGLLHHVGFTSAIKANARLALTQKIEALKAPSSFTGNTPGGPSRWANARSAEWQPVRPELVVEVSYDHFTGGRFRHGTQILRWRPDKAPRQCTMDQVKQKAANLMSLLGTSAAGPASVNDK